MRGNPIHPPAIAMLLLILVALAPIAAGGSPADPPPLPLSRQEPVATLGRINAALSEVAATTIPAVVSVATSKTVIVRQSPFDGMFEEPFLREFFGDNLQDFIEEKKTRASSLGSGVLVSADGYILTNNHVIKDAEEIIITLHDLRRFPGKLIGTDPKSDLALIKVAADGLPFLPPQSSHDLHTGEIVLAVGIPFGFSHTVTMGIVSAVGRSNVGFVDYEDFIQTDAAINPGNSGGALVNIHGELVGINTAIFSTSGGNMGVSFAIPSSMARSVMESLIKHGKVIRGWLGVSLQDITPELAKHFSIDPDRGVLVSSLMKDSPAVKAGIRQGDVIVSFKGKEVSSAADLKNLVASTLPGTPVRLTVIRRGEELSLTALLIESPDAPQQPVKLISDKIFRGVHLSEITPQIRAQRDIPAEINGLLVISVEGSSPAFGTLSPGDIILQVNRRDVASGSDFMSALDNARTGQELLLLVYRGGNILYLSLNPG